jgi:uncharacterized membrane protein YjjP (DUF1212 family)
MGMGELLKYTKKRLTKFLKYLNIYTIMNFNTSKKINLKKTSMTQQIEKMAESCETKLKQMEGQNDNNSRLRKRM